MDEKQADPEWNEKGASRVFGFLGFLVILVGQIFLYTDRVQDGVVVPVYVWIDLVGMVLFILSWRYSSSARGIPFPQHFRFPLHVLGIVASISLSLLAILAMTLFASYGRASAIPVLTFWFLAGICYFASFLKDNFTLVEGHDWLKLHRYEIVGVALIAILGMVLRFYKLGEIPRVVNGDEGQVGLAALSTNTYPYVNPFALWENFGALYLQAINYCFSLLGVSPFSLRLMPAIGGTLAIPALYLLARQISGHRIALIAAGLMAVSHTQIHFSRTVAVAYIQGTWLIPLELYFLLSGLEKRSSWRTALAGILLAIHFSVYLDSQIIAGLILMYMAIAFLFMRAWFKPALPQAYVFWGGFGVMILPEAIYAAQHPGEFFDRLNANGTFQSGWLTQTSAGSGQNAFQLLEERIVHAFLSMIYYPSFDFYGSPVPMLSMLSAVLFLIGLGMVLWKLGQPGVLLLTGYFWAGTVAVGLFSIPPSADTYRMLIVLPAAFLLAAIGLDGIFQTLGIGWPTMWKVYTAATVLTLFSLLVFNIWAYYFDFAGRCLYGSDSGPTRFASYLGNYVRTVDKEGRVYLLSDDVYFYGSHPSVDFLSGTHPITNITDSVDTLQIEPDETIIANPNRIAELRNWASNHPEGKLHYEYDCKQTILLAYQVP